MSIKEIAKMAGVSPATVSRVLNNPDYHCSSEEVREKIWEAAIRMNYVPNQAARNLKMGISAEGEKTYYINVLITRMDAARTDPFFSELLRVVESEIHRHVCILSKVWFEPVFSNDKKCRSVNLQRLIDTLYQETQEYADGLVIIGKCDNGALKIWQKKYKSIVSVNRNSTNYEVDEVLCDGYKIAQMAVEHLISLGHTRIGYVGQCRNETRYKGYLDALRRHEIEALPEYIVETEQTEMEGYKTMKNFSQEKNVPSGIYCANDITAIGMLKFLSQKKRASYMPSIIASDDIEEAQNIKPMLTTVRLPKEEMGRFAVRLLLDRMKEGHSSVTRVELEGKLMLRSSCRPYGIDFLS